MKTMKILINIITLPIKILVLMVMVSLALFFSFFSEELFTEPK